MYPRYTYVRKPRIYIYTCRALNVHLNVIYPEGTWKDYLVFYGTSDYRHVDSDLHNACMNQRIWKTVQDVQNIGGLMPRMCSGKRVRFIQRALLEKTTTLPP